jgi:hypothetical protein
MSNLSYEIYTEKSITVNGSDTKKDEVKKALMDLGGKYNPNLRTGPGWIFPKKSEPKVKEFIMKYQSQSHDRSQSHNKPVLSESKDIQPEFSEEKILKDIENAVKYFSFEKRCHFISMVSNICAKTPVKTNEKNENRTRSIENSAEEFEFEDSDNFPVKRLLRN